MKRILTILFILTICMSAFSQGISVGVGASGAYYWDTFSSTFGGTTTSQTVTQVPLNFKAFIDVTYLEASVGYMMVNGATGTTDPVTLTTTYTDKSSFLSLSLMAKYPFNLGPTVTLFPLVGVEYYKNLSYTDANGNDLKAALPADQQADLDQFWISAGIGADISLGKIIYIRPEILVGYKFLSKFENDTVTFYKGLGASSASYTPIAVSGGLSVGFKL